MSDNTAVAAPVAVESPASAENTEVSQENEGLEAAEGEESEESTEEAGKVDPKTAKPSKKEEKKTKEVEKRIKKLKLKVDGKEFEEDFDMDDEERLVRELQMAKMGQKRAQQHSDLEKQVRSFFQAFEKDPFAAMSELGMKPEQQIEDYINKQMEQAKKSPEQIQREQLETELQRIKAEREAEKEEGKSKELARLQEQAFQQYDIQMEQALSKSDLPKTPYTVKKIADYMLVALQAGKDVSPEDVIPLVREEMHSDLKEMFAALPEDVVEGLLGEQVLNKLRQRRIAKSKNAQIPGSKLADTGKSSKNTDTKQSGDKKSFKDFFGI